MPLEGRSRRRSQRSHDAREPVARSGEERPADDVQLVLALQRMAGNQAVARSATLHRKVKIGKTTLTAAPAVPPVVLEESGLKAAALKAEATKWVNDKVTDKSRTFTDDEHFYRTVAKSVASASAASEDARWTILGKAAKKNGKVTEVKWSTFNSVEGPLLLAELTACTIQLSSNSDTTAAHGNAHGKLPKKGLGENLKKLSAGDQCDKTPYFEFLVAGQVGERYHSRRFRQGRRSRVPDRALRRGKLCLADRRTGGAGRRLEQEGRGLHQDPEGPMRHHITRARAGSRSAGTSANAVSPSAHQNAVANAAAGSPRPPAGAGARPPAAPCRASPDLLEDAAGARRARDRAARPV